MDSSIEIVEVGPRDGFQSIPQLIPTETKISLIRELYQAGLRRMEVGSFVSRSAVPQFADILEVLSAARTMEGLDPQVLVPTERRANEAMAAGAGHIVFVLSASERHNMSNVRRTVAESVAEYRQIVRNLPAGIRVRLNVATVFDCPFEGSMDVKAAISLLDQIIEVYPYAEVGLCDTTGRVLPDHVERLFTLCFERYPPTTSWAFHAHDTYGLGMTNVFSAWRAGVRVVDASFAGLGGCPFAPGATGNVATEDLVFLFKGLGVYCGVDLERIVTAANRAKALPGAQYGGRVREALTGRQRSSTSAPSSKTNSASQ